MLTACSLQGGTHACATLVKFLLQFKINPDIWSQVCDIIKKHPKFYCMWNTFSSL